MSAAMKVTPMPDGFVRLVASMSLHSDPERVAALIAEDVAPCGGEMLAPHDGSDLRRFAIDLHLHIGGRSGGLTTFSKAAYLDLGRPRRTRNGWEAEISWRAATAAPLFPVFSGWLLIGPEELRIEGLYAPPGGVVGLVADRMLLHVAANATARWVLKEIDRAALGASS